MFRRVLVGLFVLTTVMSPFAFRPTTARALNGFSPPVITNLTDVSVTITWETAQQVFAGAVTYGTTKPPALRSTESGISGALGDVHTVSLGGLAPQKTYYFSTSLSGYTDDNGGAYYTFTTGPTLSANPTNQMIAGKVVKADQATPAVGVSIALKVIYYAADGHATSAALSTLTDTAGNWKILLNNLRTSDASASFSYPTTGSSNFILYSVLGGSLGDLQTPPIQMTFSGTNQFTVPNAVLIAGLPTATPTPITPTTSPTRTLTPAPTALTISTPSLTPLTPSSPRVSPAATTSSTLLLSTETPPPPTDVPTATPVDTPTDVPTPEIPTDTPEPPTAIPSPSPSATATAVPPTLTLVPTPDRPTPGALVVATPWPTLVRMPLFATTTLSDTVTAIPSPSPTPIATIDASPPAPVNAPEPRPTLALLLGLALVVVGIVVVTAGFVDRVHDT